MCNDSEMCPSFFGQLCYLYAICCNPLQEMFGLSLCLIFRHCVRWREGCSLTKMVLQFKEDQWKHVKALWDPNTECGDIPTAIYCPFSQSWHPPAWFAMFTRSKLPWCTWLSLSIMAACTSSLLCFHLLPNIFPQGFYSKPLEVFKKQKSCHMRLTALRCNTPERCDVC